MIFRRRKHPLPKFPPTIRPTFKALCEVLSVEEAESKLRPTVSAALADLQRKSTSNELIDIHLAEALALRCFELLDRYKELSNEQKSLAIGAIRYFADAGDSLSEDGFATGLDDDAKIMNHVLEELGATEGFIAYRR